MTTLSNAIALATKLKDLFRLLESGELATLFADIEFAAAREAFARIPTSSDHIAQVRTCIGHLNSSYHAYSAALGQMSKIDRVMFARSAHFGAVKTKVSFVLCVRAICHRYVSEDVHCAEDLKLAENFRKLDLDAIGAQMLWFVSGAVINPLVYFDLVTMMIKNEGPTSRQYELTDPTFEKLQDLFRSK